MMRVLHGRLPRQLVLPACVVVVLVVVVTAVLLRPREPAVGPTLPPPVDGPSMPGPMPVAEWAVEPDAREADVPDHGSGQTPALEPGRLEIPSIGVATALATAPIVGGVFQVPPIDRIGIHRTGRGDDLDAVLADGPGTVLAAGHVTWNGDLGPLYELHRLAPGAVIHTSDDSGRVRTWRAIELRLVSHDALPDDLLAPTGEPRLMLVTCAGNVIEVDGRREYAQNLVVSAVPV